MLFKKAICLLSSAVLLCGASAIPASADTTTAYNPSASSRPSTITTAYNPSANSRPSTTTTTDTGRSTGRSTGRVGKLQYYLDCGDIELAEGENKIVTAKRSAGHPLADNSTVSYQWYCDDTEVNGATEAAYKISSKGTYYCKVTVKTAYTTASGRGGRGRTIYNTEEFETEKIKVYVPLRIIAQPDICYIDERTDVATVSVFAYGGHAPYTYEWKNYGTKLSETSNIIGVSKTGFYVCTITDAVGNIVISKQIQVKYPDVKIDSYTDYILFDRAFGTAQTATIKIKASGGAGPSHTYTYFLQKKGKNNEWYDVTYSYKPEFELKFEDINDNYQYINQKPYYRDGKWHYWGTSRNTNYYRVYVRSYGNWGVIAGSATTGEITVIRKNGQEDSFTSDYFYY